MTHDEAVEALEAKADALHDEWGLVANLPLITALRMGAAALRHQPLAGTQGATSGIASTAASPAQEKHSHSTDPSPPVTIEAQEQKDDQGA